MRHATFFGGSGSRCGATARDWCLAARLNKPWGQGAPSGSDCCGWDCFLGDQLEVQGRGLGVLFLISFLFSFFSFSFPILLARRFADRHHACSWLVVGSDVMQGPRLRYLILIECGHICGLKCIFFYFLFLGISRGTFLERDLNPPIGAHIPWYQTGLPRSYVGLYSTICLTPCQAICFEELVEATRQDSRRHL